MLIDWITLQVNYKYFTEDQISACMELGDRIIRYDPKTAEVRYEVCAWESVRSDSHQIACKAGSESLYIQGSPARVMANGCSVFGDPVSSLDMIACVHAMCVQAGQFLGFIPNWFQCSIHRLDITGNLALGSLAEVRQALGFLRGVEGGRYRVSQTAGDTVYWSHTSKLRAGKAYAKGPHLRYLSDRAGYNGPTYNQDLLAKADKLLRLELKLGSQYWRERSELHWWDYSPQHLIDIWRDYFGRMIDFDDIRVKQMDNDLLQRVIDSAASPGQGRAAWATWCMIRSDGWQYVRDLLPRATFYRHIKILRSAGITDVDISHGRVVPFVAKPLVLTPVQSWQDIAA